MTIAEPQTPTSVLKSFNSLPAAKNLPDFIQANAQFASEFNAAGLPAPPMRKAAIVTCMDARLHPEKALGLEYGDCHIIRNAGGRAADAVRSIAISQQLLGTEEIFIIHHTNCGMVSFTNDFMHGLLKERLGAETGMDFMPFKNLEQSVVDDVALIVKSPLIKPGTPVVGMIYDVDTAKLHIVSTGETPCK